jgi:hypothetical protein
MLSLELVNSLAKKQIVSAACQKQRSSECALLPTQTVSKHPKSNDEIGQQRSKSKLWSCHITPRLPRVN